MVKKGRGKIPLHIFFFPRILFSESHPSSQGSSGVHQGWERICLRHVKACLKIVDSDSRLPTKSTLGSLAQGWNKGSMGARMGSTSGKNRQNSRRRCLNSLGSSDLTQEKVESLCDPPRAAPGARPRWVDRCVHPSWNQSRWTDTELQN